MQYRPILNVGIGTDCDGFGVVSSNGGREPDGGVFVEDYVANDGGVGCYPGRGSDARDVGSKFVYSFHLDGVLWVRQPTQLLQVQAWIVPLLINLKLRDRRQNIHINR